MVIVRILGVWLLLAAMVILTVDGTKSLADGDQWIATPLGDLWYMIHAASLNVSQAAVERYVSPVLWDPVILSLLQIPAWAVFAGLGILLYWLARPRRRLEVYRN